MCLSVCERIKRIGTCYHRGASATASVAIFMINRTVHRHVCEMQMVRSFKGRPWALLNSLSSCLR